MLEVSLEPVTAEEGAQNSTNTWSAQRSPQIGLFSVVLRAIEVEGVRTSLPWDRMGRMPRVKR